MKPLTPKGGNKKKRGFFVPRFRGGGNSCCVALLYALFINDLNDAVSDTTKMPKEQRLSTKEIISYNYCVIVKLQDAAH